MSEEISAEDGWVPSPGRSLPEPQVSHVTAKISIWLILFGYTLMWTFVTVFWQRRKARIILKAGGDGGGGRSGMRKVGTSVLARL